jgi:hypothetical protein
VRASIPKQRRLAKQRTDVEASPRCGVHGVDDHRDANPRALGISYQIPDRGGLPARLDPVVYEKNTVRWAKKVWTDGEGEAPVLVVGRRCPS